MPRATTARSLAGRPFPPLAPVVLLALNLNTRERARKLAPLLGESGATREELRAATVRAGAACNREYSRGERDVSE